MSWERASYEASTIVCRARINGKKCGVRIHVNDNLKWHALRYHFEMPADEIPVRCNEMRESLEVMRANA